MKFLQLFGLIGFIVYARIKAPEAPLIGQCVVGLMIVYWSTVLVIEGPWRGRRIVRRLMRGLTFWR